MSFEKTEVRLFSIDSFSGPALQTNSTTSVSILKFTKWRKVLVKFLTEGPRYKPKIFFRAS